MAHKLFVLIVTLLVLMIMPVNSGVTAQAQADSAFIAEKVKGLFYGTLIGDALGGPIEFQGHSEIQATPHPPKLWKAGELIDSVALKDAAARIYLREYQFLRPVPEPYAHWSKMAAPGTITDDSRHKIVLMWMLRRGLKNKVKRFSDYHMAKAYMDWSSSKVIKRHSGYDTLCKQWLEESSFAIRWLMGERDLAYAYPLERLWNALPTCYGQMVLPPFAALFPGKPIQAYKQAYSVAYFDNGFAKDMNAAIVGALSVALTLDPSKQNNEQLWAQVKDALRNTDPFNYAKVPWSDRATNKWLDLADQFAKDANGSPHALFERLDKELLYAVKWEAHVPYVVIFSCLNLCKYDPLAALQLSIEWGWDHDSYAQLLGAFIGAVYGPQIFKEEWKNTVATRLKADYDENIDEWVRITEKLRQMQTKK